MNALSVIVIDSPAVEFVKRDPWPFIGFASFAAGNFAYFRMLLKLQKSGASDVSKTATWKIPLLFLRQANQCGWSRWLAFVTPFFYAFGAAFLIYGLFHLYD